MAVLKLTGEVGYDITLYNVVSQIQDLRNKNSGTITQLDVYITSMGGNSYEARDIYNYLKKLEFPVNTIAVDYVYSAGMTIFLAGEKRTANDNFTEFLIHNPIYMDIFAILDESDLKEIEKMLKDEREVLVGLYSECLGIDSETIQTLMDKNEFISAETARGLGIISEITHTIEKTDATYQIAASYYVNENHNNLIKKAKNIMDENLKLKLEQIEKDQKESKGILAKLSEGIKNLFDRVVKNLTINTEEGTELIVDGDELVEGASVNVESGTFTVAYQEKMWTVVIENSVIMTITEIEEEETQENEEVENLKKENAELKKQLAEIQNKIDPVTKEHAELKKYVANLKKATSQYVMPDGSYNFKGIANQSDGNEDDDAVATVRAKREKKN